MGRFSAIRTVEDSTPRGGGRFSHIRTVEEDIDPVGVQGPRDKTFQRDTFLQDLGSNEPGQRSISEALDDLGLRKKPLSEVSGFLETAGQGTLNLAKAVPRIAPELLAAAVDDPVEFAKGLITFAPEQADLVMTALAQPSRTGKGDKVPRSFHGKMGFAGEQLFKQSPEQIAEAREQIFQNPEGPIMAALFAKGIAGKLKPKPRVITHAEAEGIPQTKVEVAPKPVPVEPTPTVRPKLETLEKQGALGKEKPVLAREQVESFAQRRILKDLEGQQSTVKAVTARVKADEIAKFDFVDTDTRLSKLSGKQVLELTDKELGVLNKQQLGANKKGRRNLVQQALSEGKTVPAEVLKDYPDLVQKPPTGVEPGVVKPKPSVKPPTKALVKAEVSKTGLNKQEIATIRKDTGLNKLEPAERKTHVRSLQEAKAGKFDQKAEGLATEVLRTKRQLTDTEHAGMVIRAAQLKEEYTGALKTASELVEKGDTKSALEARGRAEAIIETLDKITEASDLAGRETARALSIRRMMVNTETYDIASVTQRARATKGSKLTPAESGKLQKVTAEHGKLEKQLEELRVDFEKTRTERDRLLAEKVLKVTSTRGTIARRSAKSRERILTDRASVKKQLQEMGFRINDITGVTTEGSFLIGKLAITYIREGVTNLAEVVRRVKSDLPQLKDRDVYQALIEKDPKIQRKARTDTQKRIAQLKTQSKLMVEIDNAGKGIFAPRKGRPQQAPEIKSLQKKLTQLRSEAYKSGIDATRLEKALQTINELQDQLRNQYRAVKSRETVPTEELKALQDKANQLRRELKVEDDLADLNQQLKTGEFKIREKPAPRQIPFELERKEIDLKRARRKVKEAINDLAPRGFGAKLSESFEFVRTQKATADISATFRQNIVQTFSHPIIVGKLIPKTLKATVSEFKYDQIMNSIEKSDNFYLYEKAKLRINDIDSHVPGRSEELFGSRLADRVPGWGKIVRASNRNMTTLLNLTRVELFDRFLKNNPNATTPELAAYADLLNVSTGIGDISALGKSQKVFNKAFWSPKLAVSRFQTPYMLWKHWRLPRVRKQIARDLGGFLATGNTIIGLAYLASLDNDEIEVGNDPTNANWGKIVIGGTTRIDIWGGFQQPARLLTRAVLSGTKKAGLTQMGEDGFSPLDQAWRFTSYKLSPLLTLPVELLRGKTAVGEPVTPGITALKSVTPLFIEDVIDAYRIAGLKRAGLAFGLAFTGVGVNTYGNRKRRRGGKPRLGGRRQSRP